MSLESGHFYTRDGKACHTQPTKSKDAKNPTRPTTITDAKRLGLLPSVSGITKMLAAPGLEVYKMKEVARQCFLSPAHPGEDESGYIQAMLEKGKEDGANAADVGTLIHDALEAHFTGGKRQAETVKIGHMDYHIDTFIHPAVKLIEKKGYVIEASEKVLVNNKEGYAGTTDLIVRYNDFRGILDFKSKRTKPGKPAFPSETHCAQIAAYSMAHWGVLEYGANLYISTTEPGRVELVEWSPQQLATDWKAFLAMRDLWSWANGYDPRQP